jgi:hypothetical protein
MSRVTPRNTISASRLAAHMNNVCIIMTLSSSQFEDLNVLLVWTGLYELLQRALA